MIDNQIKITEIFNEYFVSIDKYLGIVIEKESETFTENNISEVEMALKKYKNHPLGNFTFSFNFISHDYTIKELNKLKSKKDSQKIDVPIKLSRKMWISYSISYIIILIIGCHALLFQVA